MLLRTKIYIGVGILVTAMGAAIFLLTKQNQRLRLEKNQAISFNLAQFQKIQQYKTDSGKLVSRIQNQELTINNLRNLIDDPRLSWIKELESVNKRLNNVEQVSQYTAEVVGNFKIPIRDTTIYVNDSTFKIRTFDNHNKWLRVSGVIMPDTIEVIPYVKVNVKSVLLWERSKWPSQKFGVRIGKKTYYSEAMTDNPYATITGMEITDIIKKGRSR